LGAHAIPLQGRLRACDIPLCKKTVIASLGSRLAILPAVHHVINETAEAHMPRVVTITRPDVIALIEKAAKKLARGNKTEAVALAMRRLLDEDARAGSLFGAHRGSVQIREGVELIAPALDVELDATTCREIER
jgi:hypothetical protein